MKKPFNVLATALVAGTVFSSALTPAFAEGESDSSASAYSEKETELVFTDAKGTIYQDAVSFLQTNGIANGIKEGYFGVDEPIKRVDAAMILGTYAEIDRKYPNTPKNTFRDLPARAVKTVSALKYGGIMNGKTGTYFGADLNITRGEAALMLYGAFKDDFYYLNEEKSISFTDVSSRYEEAVRKLSGAGIVKGTAGRFGTSSNITRGQLALMIHRIDQYHESLKAEEKAGFVAFGDSNTSGSYFDSQFKDYLGKKWTDQVAAVYGAGLEWEVYNAGFSGNTTKQGLKRFKDEVLQVKPQSATIMFGINDSLLYRGQPQVSKEEFRTNLEFMIHQLKLRSVNIVLMTNPAVVEQIYYASELKKGRNVAASYEKLDGVRSWINEYNDIIREVAEKDSLPLVDTYNLLVETAGGATDDKLIESGLLDDETGIHMTPKANDLVAAEVISSLAK